MTANSLAARAEGRQPSGSTLRAWRSPQPSVVRRQRAKKSMLQPMAKHWHRSPFCFCELAPLTGPGYEPQYLPLATKLTARGRWSLCAPTTLGWLPAINSACCYNSPVAAASLRDLHRKASLSLLSPKSLETQSFITNPSHSFRLVHTFAELISAWFSFAVQSPPNLRYQPLVNPQALAIYLLRTKEQGTPSRKNDEAYCRLPRCLRGR